MSNERIDALAFARAVIVHMPGWALDKDTRRMIAEDDTYARTWAGIEHPDHPGANITISSSSEKGKLSISANYPRDWQPYIDGRGRVYSESIRVSATKTPEQIAKEINRRLLDATGYLARAAECIETKTASEQRQANGESLARELAAHVGAQTTADRTKNSPGCRHLQTDENRRQFSVYAHNADGTTNYSRGIDCKVSHGGDSVDLKLQGLTPGEAADILLAWTLRNK